MKTDIKEINDFTRELAVTVPWEDLKEHFQAEFNRFRAGYSRYNGSLFLLTLVIQNHVFEAVFEGLGEMTGGNILNGILSGNNLESRYGSNLSYPG